MTKTHTGDTTQKKPSTFTWFYELIKNNPIQTVITAGVAILGAKKFASLQHKSTATKTKKSGSDIEKRDTQKLKDIIRRIEALLKKSLDDAYEGDSDAHPTTPMDLGSQAAAALPARSEALEEMAREHSALLNHEAPEHEVTITRNGNEITIVLADRTTITAATDDFLEQNHNQALEAWILSGAETIYIFSNGEIQQVTTAKNDEEAEHGGHLAADDAVEGGNEQSHNSPAPDARQDQRKNAADNPIDNDGQHHPGTEITGETHLPTES